MLVHFDGKYAGRAHGSGDGDRKKSNRAASRDGYGFRGDLTGENCVNSIAQRIENRRVFRWNGGIKLPDIRFWNDDVFRKSAVGIDADDLHVLADVRLAGAALQALAAGHVHFGGNEIAFLYAGDFVAECGYLAAKFVPGNQRRVNAALRPAIPVVDM